MKKVLSWTVGSFFRTIGRIIAYLIIGGILVWLINNSGFKWSIPSILFSDVYAATIDECSQTVKLNNVTVTQNSTTELAANTNYHLQINEPSVIGDDVFTHGKYYTDITLVTNLPFGNYTGVSNNAVYSILNLGYTSTALGFGANDGVWRIRILWDANDTLDLSDGRLQAIYEYNIHNYGGSVNYLGGARILSVSCGLQSDMSNTTEQDAELLRQFNTLQSNINATENAVNYNGQAQRDNDDENTQDIIDNQNANTQSQIDSQKVCEYIDKSNIETDGYYLNANGGQVQASNYGITNYISISKDTEIKVQKTGYVYSCFYNTNKEKISCLSNSNLTIDQLLTIPSGASYFRASIFKTENRPTFYLCKNGNQALQDSLSDSNTSQASSQAGNFFNNFTTDTHGLTGIITAPLNAIQSLSNQNCSPLILPLPYINQNLTLPCMRQIYEDNFGDFMDLYDIITLGIISYWVMVRIFALVKDFKNPEHDEIEVVDL